MPIVLELRHCIFRVAVGREPCQWLLLRPIALVEGIMCSCIGKDTASVKEP